MVKFPELFPLAITAGDRGDRRRAGVAADVAGRVADAAAVENVQRAVAVFANMQLAGIGPGRAGAVHRRRARRATTIADEGVIVADAAAVEDAQRAVAVQATYNWPELVQAEPVPSTVAVLVEPSS